MDEESEELRLLRENNKMLKEMLEIARKYTDPEYLKNENNNDFFMNVLANIVAKKLEQKFGI